MKRTKASKKISKLKKPKCQIGYTLSCNGVGGHQVQGKNEGRSGVLLLLGVRCLPPATGRPIYGGQREMTTEKLRSVLDFYREWIRESLGVLPAQEAVQAARPCHLAWMCEEAASWDEAHRDKAMRWLGFVQGVLFAQGHFTLEELRNHSRPDNVESK